MRRPCVLQREHITAPIPILLTAQPLLFPAQRTNQSEQPGLVCTTLATTQQQATHLRRRDPALQKRVAPPKGQRQVVASAQRHHRHGRRGVQAQLPNGFEDPCDGAVAACCQDAQVPAGREWGPVGWF